MNCNECLEVISEYVDGMLELGAQTKIERHLADCESCRAVRDDLLQIVHFSGQLPMQAPTRDLWVGIKTQIEADRPKTYLARAKHWWQQLHNRDLYFTVPRMAALAASFILLVVVGVTIFKNFSPNANQVVNGNVSPAQQEHLGFKDLEPYEKRIGELKEAVEQKKKNWDANLQLSFERSMISVEDSLNESRREFNNNPSDENCRELLINAYREKVRVLEGFADFKQ
ncbi:MAG: zf-HC2 domain-containing protein [Acidobacteriota bacterium]